ncbi:MAG: hypothetical protein N2255_05060, partial [Kiritimatiellae bacterium]|nr:hypothetical protein [Kiritimatiellia bacterium]
RDRRYQDGSHENHSGYGGGPDGNPRGGPDGNPGDGYNGDSGNGSYFYENRDPYEGSDGDNGCSDGCSGNENRADRYSKNGDT